MNERRRIHFSGRVQGVGFRYTACHVARGFPVSGFVQNLPDGRVVLVVEGAAAEIDSFIAELSRHMAGYVRDVTSETSAATGEFHGFTVHH